MLLYQNSTLNIYVVEICLQNYKIILNDALSLDKNLQWK